MSILKRRLDSKWSTITVTGVGGEEKQTFSLDRYGRLSTKFEKMNPRRLKAIFRELDKPTVPKPFIVPAISSPSTQRLPLPKVAALPNVIIGRPDNPSKNLTEGFENYCFGNENNFYQDEPFDDMFNDFSVDDLFENGIESSLFEM